MTVSRHESSTEGLPQLGSLACFPGSVLAFPRTPTSGKVCCPVGRRKPHPSDLGGGHHLVHRIPHIAQQGHPGSLDSVGPCAPGSWAWVSSAHIPSGQATRLQGRLAPASLPGEPSPTSQAKSTSLL